jgi:hypothetical protein
MLPSWYVLLPVFIVRWLAWRRLPREELGRFAILKPLPGVWFARRAHESVWGCPICAPRPCRKLPSPWPPPPRPDDHRALAELEVDRG